ncbi:acyl-CoA-like ligand-binding transcription factor [Fodinicola feengrottensis]|uniref:acyl-CoA-like ligand-binding transcription factor n=1 Tax=Fodinicola feengrottensis TaxID=435914 RepID=UPI00244338A8|nr:TetR family transcriptional regulator [Fodinicola feengrottensis]
MPGLRERKKQATRQALRETALRLAEQHGLDGLTVEAVCAEVGVSTRTFFNYFPSKEDALVGDGPALPPDAVVDRIFAEHAADGPIAGASAVLLHMVDTGTQPDVRHKAQMFERFPTLVPALLAKFAAFERSLAEAVARNMGPAPRPDFYPELVAACAVTAMRVAAKRWSTGDREESLASYTHGVFEVFRKELA